MYKQIILNKISEYLKLKNWNMKKSGKILMFQCPFCKQEPITAQQIPNTSKVNCFHCKKQYNLIDIVKEIEPDKKDSNEEDIFQYLKESLNVQVTTKKEENDLEHYLNFFEKIGFDLVPVAKNAKNCIEQDWTNKEHKNKEEWVQWRLNGLNFGAKTGVRSNITVLDLDVKEIPDFLKPYLDTTLVQETRKGYHFFFQYEKDLPKTRIDEYKIDLENDGGQVVIHPSIVENTKRTFRKLIAPIKMPEELLKKVKEHVTVPRKTNSELLKDDIKTENFKLNLFEEGTRNASLIKLGGIFRKELNAKQTEFILHTLNNHNTDSLPYKEINAMARKLEHYIEYDEQDLAHQIIEYLKITESASKAEIEIAVLGKRATGEDKKRIDKTLVYLIKEEKIIKKGERQYKLLQTMNWEETIVNVGVPIGFKVPYLNDYAYFNKGDFIVLGSQNKYGKTTLSMNVVKKFVDQGIKPYYIYSESGGRFAKTALQLGMKDGDFFHIFCGNPEEIRLEPNAITIYDWVRPTDGFNKTDELYDKIVQKLHKTQGFMICFVQLKKDNSWFAPNMITQYPALACKYLYEDESDGTNTKFEITEVRDSKIRGKKFEIPCTYNWETKMVTRIDDLKKEK